MWLILNAKVEIFFFEEVRVNQRIAFRIKEDPTVYTGKLLRKGLQNGLHILLDSGGEVKTTTYDLVSAKILYDLQLNLFLESDGQFFYP